MDKGELSLLRQIAVGIARQFGNHCEVAIHDISRNDPEHSIVYIENGYVSGRHIGDGMARVVLEQTIVRAHESKAGVYYQAKTADGKTLRTSMIYIRDHQNRVLAILEISYDISLLVAGTEAVQEFAAARNGSATDIPNKPFFECGLPR